MPDPLIVAADLDAITEPSATLRRRAAALLRALNAEVVASRKAMEARSYIIQSLRGLIPNDKKVMAAANKAILEADAARAATDRVMRGEGL